MRFFSILKAFVHSDVTISLATRQFQRLRSLFGTANLPPQITGTKEDAATWRLLRVLLTHDCTDN
ncbi:MAG: hypothetical protein DMG50_17120 [Acidobacteria bacterium]|nr:MAG: hypothetical protein DMG50_17120 [Acidobacteriota bacterium]